MTWLSAMPAVLLVAAMFVIPGALMGRAIGLRRTLLWGMAPLFSTAMYAIGSSCAAAVGLQWSAAGILTVLIAGLGITFVAGRVVDATRVGRDDPDIPRPPDSAHLAAAGAMLLGALLVAVPAALGMGSPDELVDSPDVIFHLSRIRQTLETGASSSFSGGQFYPGAFHSIATAAVGLGAPADPVVLANVVALVAVCVAWPLGCVALGRQLFGWRPVALLLTGIAAASFTAYPSIMLGWGVLWPNVLGQALLPGFLAGLVACVTAQEGGGVTRASAVIASVMALPGLLFAHPNALVMAAVFAAVWVGWRLLVTILRGPRRRSALLGLAALVLGSAAALVVAPKISPAVASTAAYTWDDTQSAWTALADVAGLRVQWDSVQWGTVVLLTLGAVAIALWWRRIFPVVLGWVACVVLYVLCASVRGDVVRLVTGFWYNDKIRLAAYAVIPGIALVVAAGLGVRRLLVSRRVLSTRPGWADGATVAMVVLLTGFTQWSARESLVNRYYHPEFENQTIATRSMIAELGKVTEAVPAGAVIAAVPESGAALLYPLFGRPTLYGTLPATGTEDQIYLGAHLAEATSDPRVCPLALRLGVGYALVSDRAYWLSKPERTRGIDAVPGRPGFVEVASTAHYRLFKLTACS